MKTNPSPASPSPAAPTLLTLDFAYPSSDSAKRFGFNDKGCYVVGMFDGVNPSKDKRGFATKSEAIAYGNAMGIGWHPLWIAHQPELATAPAAPCPSSAWMPAPVGVSGLSLAEVGKH